MGQMPVYRYRIPLEQTGDGVEPVYDYPEENEYTYQDDGHLVVIQTDVIPHFHKDSIPVRVDVLVGDEDEWEEKVRDSSLPANSPSDVSL